MICSLKVRNKKYLISEEPTCNASQDQASDFLLTCNRTNNWISVQPFPAKNNKQKKLGMKFPSTTKFCVLLMISIMTAAIIHISIL